MQTLRYFRAAIVAAIALGAMTAVTACGQTDLAASQALGTSVQKVQAPVVHQVHVPVPRHAIHLLTSTQARRLDPLPWILLSTQAGGRQLVIFVTTGCSKLVGAMVRDAPTQVTVTPLGTVVPPDQPCIGTGGGQVVKVQLPAPIGGKQLARHS